GSAERSCRVRPGRQTTRPHRRNHRQSPSQGWGNRRRLHRHRRHRRTRLHARHHPHRTRRIKQHHHTNRPRRTSTPRPRRQTPRNRPTHLRFTIHDRRIRHWRHNPIRNKFNTIRQLGLIQPISNIHSSI